jgi:hypothetical protein
VAETIHLKNALIVIAIADPSEIKLIILSSVQGTHGIRHAADVSYLVNSTTFIDDTIILSRIYFSHSVAVLKLKDI